MLIEHLQGDNNEVEKDEIEYLIAHAGKMKNKELSLIMGRTINQSRVRRSVLVLRWNAVPDPMPRTDRHNSSREEA